MSALSSPAVLDSATGASLAQRSKSSLDTSRRLAEFAGRILLSGLFLASGLGKITAYAGTAAYMSSLGVPGALLPVALVTEVLGAIAIIVGWQTRMAAFLLAGYSLLTAVIFHANFADQVEMVMFLKNVSIAGGLLLLVANGAGAWSVDSRKTARAEGQAAAR